VSLCASALLFSGGNITYMRTVTAASGGKGRKKVYIYNVKFGRDVSSGCRKRAESPADFGSGQYARGPKKKKKAHRAFFLLYMFNNIYTTFARPSTYSRTLMLASHNRPGYNNNTRAATGIYVHTGGGFPTRYICII